MSFEERVTDSVGMRKSDPTYAEVLYMLKLTPEDQAEAEVLIAERPGFFPDAFLRVLRNNGWNV